MNCCCFPPNPLYGLEYELQTSGRQVFDMMSLFEIALHSSMCILPQSIKREFIYFPIIVHLVAWPLNESEDGVDLV